MTPNTFRNLLAACLLACGALSVAGAEARAQDLFGLNLFGQPAAVVPVQPVVAAPAAVTYVPEARGLFGRRIAYRPVVTYPAAMPAVAAVTPAAAYAPAVVTAGYAPVAMPVAAPVATTSYYAPAVASPSCGCATTVAAPVTSYLPAAPVASGCSSCSATTSYFAPAVAAPVVVAPVRRLPYDPPVPFTGLFALPN